MSTPTSKQCWSGMNKSGTGKTNNWTDERNNSIFTIEKRKIQSTSVDTFNRRELKAMYEKPYKMLTSSSGNVEGKTRDEVDKDKRSTEFNHLR
ncbi:hypothetical protein BLOT_011436 [Blomia tropicalis]|nr:hypothetical protein BLOT_011436 [Blomia tropicalis]